MATTPTRSGSRSPRSVNTEPMEDTRPAAAVRGGPALPVAGHERGEGSRGEATSITPAAPAARGMPHYQSRAPAPIHIPSGAGVGPLRSPATGAGAGAGGRSTGTGEAKGTTPPAEHFVSMLNDGRRMDDGATAASLEQLAEVAAAHRASENPLNADTILALNRFQDRLREILTGAPPPQQTMDGTHPRLSDATLTQIHAEYQHFLATLAPGEPPVTSEFIVPTQRSWACVLATTTVLSLICGGGLGAAGFAGAATNWTFGPPALAETAALAGTVSGAFGCCIVNNIVVSLLKACACCCFKPSTATAPAPERR